MEGAFYRPTFADDQTVAGQNGSDGEGRFYSGDGHWRVGFHLFLQLKEKHVEQSSSKNTSNVPFCKT